MRNEKYAIFTAQSPKFPRVIGNRGGGRHRWRQILNRKWNYSRFAHVQWKVCHTTVIYGWIAEISASYRKLLSRSTMMTSYFRADLAGHWADSTFHRTYCQFISNSGEIQHSGVAMVSFRLKVIWMFGVINSNFRNFALISEWPFHRFQLLKCDIFEKFNMAAAIFW